MSLRDYTGNGAAELFVTSPWGVGVLAFANGALQSKFVAPSGTVFGSWRSDASENHFGPSGFFDGSDAASVLVTSGWGVGILKAGPSGLTSLALAPNGTTLQGPEIGGENYNFINFALDTTATRFGPVGNFDGDGRQSVIAVNQSGIATLGTFNGALVVRSCTPFDTPESGGWKPTADDWFGPAADYDGDGKDEAFVVGPWGIAIVRLASAAQATLAEVGNGGAIGGWTLDMGVDQFGPAGDFDGDGRPECVIRNANGFALLKLVNGALTTVGAFTSGGWIGGWRTSGQDRLGPAADFNGDKRAELLVTSGWGMGVLRWNGTAWGASGIVENGTPCGHWRIDTKRDRLNVADDFDRDGRAELLVSSGWGVGLLDLSGEPTSKLAVANGAALGSWRLDTVNNNLECGASSLAMIISHSNWNDAVGTATTAFRNRGAVVLATQDPPTFINALKGFASTACPGDRLFVYLAVHGGTVRVGPDTSTGPCSGHVLEAQNGFFSLGDLSPSFRTAAYRGCDLIVFDGSCEGGETVVDAGGQPYCAVASTSPYGPAATDFPDLGREIGAMAVPSVFGTWWTSPHLIASRLNGQILTAPNNGTAASMRIHQRMYRNDGTACTSQAIWARTALSGTTTLSFTGNLFWWVNYTDCYLTPILFPFETSQLQSPPPWTATADTLLQTAAGFVDPWRSLLAPYQSGVLDAAAEPDLARSYAENFNTIWQCLFDDPAWNPTTDAGKHEAGLFGLNLTAFAGPDGFAHLVNHAYFCFLFATELYDTQRNLVSRIDAAVRQSTTLKNKVPKAMAVKEPKRIIRDEIDVFVKKNPALAPSSSPTSQGLNVALAPWPPIVRKPTAADPQNFIDTQLSRLTAGSIKQTTGDTAVDLLLAQLLATNLDQSTCLQRASLLLSVIEDVVCAKQSGGQVSPGENTRF